FNTGLNQSIASFNPYMLPPVLPCLSWFVSLYVNAFFIVFCCAVAYFLKFLFLFGWLCKLFDKALV
ncbi:MAG: hypothetical protein LC117_11615, partial [Bacteroidia bacterium]|nr:hypothetical protein [Bacteroidia bacterium]